VTNLSARRSAAPLRASPRDLPPTPGGSSLRRIGLLALWAATVGGIAWGLRWTERAARAGVGAPRCQLAWIDLPPWLTLPDNEWVLREVTAAAGLRENDDLHDPQLCARIGESLAESPWVARVERVRRHADGTVTIRAAFREPVACVEKGKRVYLVDQDGVRLPPEYPADAIDPTNPSNPLLIVGVSTPAPPAGVVWAGKTDPNRPAPELEAGLKLVRHFREAAVQGRLPFRSSIRAIDVANFDLKENAFDGRLRIRTIYPRCYIRWGEPPGAEYPVEPTANRKLDMLRSLYVEQGQFVDGQILDVRKAEGIEKRAFPGGDGRR